MEKSKKQSVRAKSNRKDVVTIRELAKEQMSHWTEEDWFKWFPDIFLLTSTVMEMSGIYRLAIDPVKREHVHFGKKTKHQKELFYKAISEWHKYILNPSEAKFPAYIEKKLASFWNTEISFYGDNIENLKKAECEAIFTLHALADTACRAFGIPSFPKEKFSTVICWANLLLEETGSLSRLPKRYGVVLPKMRTPQSGLTLRSFSHHLTFHKSEVNVKWRTIPWLNQDENTINILVVPLPYKIYTKDFKKMSSESSASHVELDPPKYNYFEFEPGEKLDPEEVVSYINNSDVERVHMLVFPETSLTEKDLDELKEKLYNRLPADKIPLIISGVRTAPKNSRFGKNQVDLSIFFAGKWYSLRQSKHHRWKLDMNQIEQYSLTSQLHPSYEWWEGIDIPHREITFLCPDDWLTICPLICEDLAQQEPISMLLRGVAPTLVISVLSDGPQLTERWSARYVGVLADDPGTSILTLTSLGMAKRSRARGKSENRTVALWKDQIKGWEYIELKDKDKGALLTATARYKEEFTADGRSDGSAAANVVLHDYNTINESETGKEIKSDEKNAETKVKSDLKKEVFEFKKSDDEELSILVYLIDSIISWTNPNLTFLEQLIIFSDFQFEKDNKNEKFREISNIFLTLKNGKPENQSKKFNLTTHRERFEELFKNIIDVNSKYSNDSDNNLLGKKNKKIFARWKELFDNMVKKLNFLKGETDLHKVCEKLGLHDGNDVRWYYLFHLTVLWSLHRRLQYSLKQSGVLIEKSNIFLQVKDCLDEVEKNSDMKKNCMRLIKDLEKSIVDFQSKEILKCLSSGG